MAKTNKKNGRRAFAVALGVIGIAGLSLASASTLTVNTSTNIAVGQGSFAAACDTAVDVDYTHGATNYTTLTISGIAPACAGKNLTYTLTTSGADPTGTIVVSGTTATVDISALPLTVDLSTIDIVIK